VHSGGRTLPAVTRGTGCQCFALGVVNGEQVCQCLALSVVVLPFFNLTAVDGWGRQAVWLVCVYVSASLCVCARACVCLCVVGVLQLVDRRGQRLIARLHQQRRRLRAVPDALLLAPPRRLPLHGLQLRVGLLSNAPNALAPAISRTSGAAPKRAAALRRPRWPPRPRPPRTLPPRHSGLAAKTGGKTRRSGPAYWRPCTPSTEEMSATATVRFSRSTVCAGDGAGNGAGDGAAGGCW
jgi:hypothetical protein